MDVINDRNFKDALREIDDEGGWELPQPGSDCNYEALLAIDEARVATLAHNLSLCMRAADSIERETNSIAVALFGQEAIRLGRPLGQTQQESACSSGSSSSAQAQPVLAAAIENRKIHVPTDDEQGDHMSWPCLHDDNDSVLIASKRRNRCKAMSWSQLLSLADVSVR